ncbi:MAG: glycosyltransferase family 2 protein [Cellulosilyticaceae bacterium]
MKILSVAVPCYNSASYMKKCIESLLVGGDDIEILIVNDGSTKDNTREIADAYAKEYPSHVRAIHKANGGHGSAVNTGIEHATGHYFKVVDSDDWVNEEALRKIIAFLKESLQESKQLDMLISNFIYDKQDAVHKKVMEYRNVLPTDTYFEWQDIKRFDVNKYILMHSVIYRTQILRDCGVKLPEHTFYVDSIYVYYPLPHVKKIYYLDVNLYHYFIGREDQSVNEKIMISRIDQQLKVNNILFDSYDLETIMPKELRHYMYRYLELICIVSSVLLIKEGSPENLAKKKMLWQGMREKHQTMYVNLRYKRLLGWVIHAPGKIGRKIVVKIYHIMQKKIGFN